MWQDVFRRKNNLRSKNVLLACEFYEGEKGWLSHLD